MLQSHAFFNATRIPFWRSKKQTQGGFPTVVREITEIVNPNPFFSGLDMAALGTHPSLAKTAEDQMVHRVEKPEDRKSEKGINRVKIYLAAIPGLSTARDSLKALLEEVGGPAAEAKIEEFIGEIDRMAAAILDFTKTEFSGQSEGNPPQATESQGLLQDRPPAAPCGSVSKITAGMINGTEPLPAEAGGDVAVYADALEQIARTNVPVRRRASAHVPAQ